MKCKKIIILALLSSQMLTLPVNATTYESTSQGYEQKSKELANTTEPSQENGNDTFFSKTDGTSFQEVSENKHVKNEITSDFLSDWEYTEFSKKIILKKYIGTEKEIVIPSMLQGKQVVLHAIDDHIVPRDIKKFSIKAEENQSIKMESITLKNAFRNCCNLVEVNLQGLDTSNIVSMESMFENCSKLEKVTLSDCNTEKLISIKSMFKDCSNLKKVDLENFFTNSVLNMKTLFYGCENLKFVDLSSFTLNDQVLSAQMFTTERPSELLIITRDEKLMNLDLSSENRLPLSGPVLRTKSGEFTNNKKEKPYFEKCIYPPEKISLKEFESFKESNKPKRSEFATKFISWEPIGEFSAKIESVLDLANVNFVAQWQDIEWEFEETDNEILLKKYIGNKTGIVVPGEINNKQVILEDINSTTIPSTITSFEVIEKNGRKVSLKDRDLTQGFYNNKALTVVDLRGLDTSNITSFKELFRDCGNLKKVNMAGVNVGKVTTFQSMFYECRKLADVDLSNLNSTNVKDMSMVFYNCYDLESLNLSNFDTTSVSTMYKMFFNCFINKDIPELDLSSFKTPNLTKTNRMFNGAKLPRIIRLDNMEVQEGADMAAMFFGKSQELIVVTKCPAILKYDFEPDHKQPMKKPVFDLNGGSIGKQNKVHYFNTCAVTPEQLTMDTFNKFKNDLVPKKSEAEFRGWESDISEDIESILQLTDATYIARWKNSTCNTSSDNCKLNSNGSIGFAYLPAKFEIPSIGLFESGQQEILFYKKESFNIGIRDISKMKSQWCLTGKINWMGETIQGAYIQFEKGENSLNKNKNDNISLFNPRKDLVSVDNEVYFAKHPTDSIHITSNEMTKIIIANSDKEHDDIYDYNLGNASLVLPEADQVKAGKVEANIQWNLMNTPG